MGNRRKNLTLRIALVGGILVVATLVFGTIWTGRSASGDTEKAVRSVSLLFLNGLEATRRIRKLDREDAKTIPIIAVTANAFDEDVQRSLQAGLNAHLSKPVEPDALFETLEGLIRP